MSARPLALPTACALALALAACGGGGPKAPAPAASKASVRRTIVTFTRELAAGNGRVACGGLTASGQSSVIGVLGPELANCGIDTCAGTVQVTGYQLTKVLRRELLTVRVGAVKLSASTATEWSQIQTTAGSLSALFGHPPAVTLRRIRGFWAISRL